MTELADIFRRYGHDYIERFADKIPRTHLKVIDDVSRCRTGALGGQVFYCEHCKIHHYSYHSCGNRHCNKCQNDQAQQWLEEKTSLLLPATHFLVTFTLPGELKETARRHQKLFYNLLFKCAARAIKKLALDFKYLGGMTGMLGILHTWGRNLSYHPHVHFVVPGVAYFRDGDALLFADENFLLPLKALSVVFRAMLRDALKKADEALFYSIDRRIWQADWVVHSQGVGSGEAAFKYLANYVFRVAISNNRILSMQDGKVTFKYLESESGRPKTMTLSVFEFMRRFLQHVLDKGFVKVRYYGFWSPANKKVLSRIKELMQMEEPETKTGDKNQKPGTIRCPTCQREMYLIAEVKPGAKWPHAPPVNNILMPNTIE